MPATMEVCEVDGSFMMSFLMYPKPGGCGPCCIVRRAGLLHYITANTQNIYTTGIRPAQPATPQSARAIGGENRKRFLKQIRPVKRLAQAPITTTRGKYISNSKFIPPPGVKRSLVGFRKKMEKSAANNKKHAARGSRQ